MCGLHKHDIKKKWRSSNREIILAFLSTKLEKEREREREKERERRRQRSSLQHLNDIRLARHRLLKCSNVHGWILQFPSGRLMMTGIPFVL
jgi:hypothetical protein